MSYSILYRAMHVKTSKGILPMIEIGDNNVYEWGNKRRARSWNNLRVNKKVLFKNWEDLNNSIETWNASYKDKQEKYRNSDEEWQRESAEGSYGYFESMAVYGKRTWTTTYNDVRNLIKSGMKYMVTMDEVIEKKVLYISGDWVEGNKQPDILVENEQMLFDALDNNKWIIFNHWGIDALYALKKAMVQMAKPRKGKKVYKMQIRNGVEKPQFISMDEDRTKFILVDNEEDAMGFTYTGVNKWWLLRQFFDFDEMSYDYVA